MFYQSELSNFLEKNLSSEPFRTQTETVQEFVKIAEGMGADNVSRLRKQDVILLY